MKTYINLLILLLLVSCGGPGKKIPPTGGGRYYSTVFTDYSGATSSCNSCLVLQVTQNTITLILNPSPGITACNGSANYRAPINSSVSYLTFPDTVGDTRNILIESVGTPPSQTDSPGGGDCFPQPNQETMIVEKTASNEYTIYFNNTQKGYIIKEY